jgi:hypothetical protein
VLFVRWKEGEDYLLNYYQPPRHSVVFEQQMEQCLVKSCSECSTAVNPDGKLNVKGLMHRSLYWDQFSMNNLDCRKCPIHRNSVRTGEFERILHEVDHQE